jgi:hypothetical protein
MKNMIVGAALALGLLTGSAAVAQTYLAPFAHLQPQNPSEFYAMIEIPAGSFSKDEIESMKLTPKSPHRRGSIPVDAGVLSGKLRLDPQLA